MAIVERPVGASVPDGAMLAAQLKELQLTLEQEEDADAADQAGWLHRRVADVVHGRAPAVVRVAFCGLFSAGKSSLLNRLSAAQGTGPAESFRTGAVPSTERVQEVILPGTDGRVVLLDTPGVDSNIDAHRLETERALAQADWVVVVTDYQHVESEANLALSRRLSEQGKRLWLVVNQLDKHIEWEVPFAEFRARVERVFADAGVRFGQVFYTAAQGDVWAEAGDETLRGVGAAGVEALAHSLAGLGEHALSIALDSALAQAQRLLQDHVQRRWAARCEDALEGLRQLGAAPPADGAQARSRWLLLHAELARLGAAREERREALREAQRLVREQLVRSVELAQIAPYETTEQGRLYVESLRPDFRVGWLGSKRKTAQEQSARLARFAADLADRTEKFLVWPLQASLRQFIQETDWADGRWLDEVDRVAVAVTPELCQSVVKPGALVSSQYPYQYVKDVVHAVKRQVFVRLTELLDSWFAAAERVVAAERADEAERRRQMAAEMACLEVLVRADEERVQRVAEWTERVMRGA